LQFRGGVEAVVGDGVAAVQAGAVGAAVHAVHGVAQGLEAALFAAELFFGDLYLLHGVEPANPPDAFVGLDRRAILLLGFNLLLQFRDYFPRADLKLNLLVDVHPAK
jgi:hypothetical protein